MPTPYQSQILDHLGLVAGMFDELGIGDIIDRNVEQDASRRQVSVGQAVKAMVLNGLGFVNQQLYLVPSFFDNKPLDRLIGPCASGLGLALRASRYDPLPCRWALQPRRDPTGDGHASHPGLQSGSSTRFASGEAGPRGRAASGHAAVDEAAQWQQECRGGVWTGRGGAPCAVVQ